MLNKILFVVCLVWLASELVSWANPPKYELQQTWHVVKNGETLWSIACDYYDKQDRYRYFGEWYYQVQKANENGKKYIYVGDAVNIPIEKRVR